MQVRHHLRNFSNLFKVLQTMKKRYMKPITRSFYVYARKRLLVGSGEEVKEFDVATNLDDLGDFGGGGDPSYGD